MSEKTSRAGGKLSTGQLSIEMRSWSPPAAVVTIDDPQWRGYTFALILDALQVAHFEVRRDPDAKPLNAWRLQRVPLALIERALRAKLSGVIEQYGRDNPTAPALFSTEDWPDPSEQTRANRDDVKLAQLAKRYVETLDQPQQAEGLAELFGYAPSSISKLIRRARDRHLLTPTSKGRPGGQLTPRAKALLGEMPTRPDQREQDVFLFGKPKSEMTTRERIEAELAIRPTPRTRRQQP